jgi:AcrR family transcriptional regulator
MPRPPQFEREEIVAAALEVARREGLREVSARRVAKQLGSSTSVIYARFDGIQDLRDALLASVLAAGTPRTLARVPSEGIRAIVRAMCLLARSEPWIVEELHLSGRANPAWAASRVAIAMSLAAVPRFASLDDAQRLALVSRITLPAVGLAASAAAGELVDVDRAYDAVVEPVIEAVLRDGPRDDLLAGRPRDQAAGSANT